MLSTFEDEVNLRTECAVKQRRESSGLNVPMLAAGSGISSSMVSDIERGAKSPTGITIVRLAAALGVSAAALVDEGKEPAPRIRILRRGDGACGEHPTRWEKLGPVGPYSRIDFVLYRISLSTVLGPSAAHAAGTFEPVHVAAGTVRHRPYYRGRRSGLIACWRQLQLPRRSGCNAHPTPTQRRPSVHPLTACVRCRQRNETSIC
jgi:hypothetical protein